MLLYVLIPRHTLSLTFTNYTTSRRSQRRVIAKIRHEKPF